jgi:hypothetical protein
MNIQSTMNLKKGDQVWLRMSWSTSVTNPYLEDDNNHSIHFTGFMLQEEIVASLGGFWFDYPKTDRKKIYCVKLYGEMV